MRGGAVVLAWFVGWRVRRRRRADEAGCLGMALCTLWMCDSRVLVLCGIGRGGRGGGRLPTFVVVVFGASIGRREGRALWIGARRNYGWGSRSLVDEADLDRWLAIRPVPGPLRRTEQGHWWGAGSIWIDWRGICRGGCITVALIRLFRHVNKGFTGIILKERGE